jgi:hypothetical protein
VNPITPVLIAACLSVERMDEIAGSVKAGPWVSLYTTIDPSGTAKLMLTLMTDAELRALSRLANSPHDGSMEAMVALLTARC